MKAYILSSVPLDFLSLGTKQDRARPIRPTDLKLMVQEGGQDLQGIHDRTMVLLGFAGALRRSELVGTNRQDVKTVREGLEVTVQRSKMRSTQREFRPASRRQASRLGPVHQRPFETSSHHQKRKQHNQ